MVSAMRRIRILGVLAAALLLVDVLADSAACDEGPSGAVACHACACGPHIAAPDAVAPAIAVPAVSFPPYESPCYAFLAQESDFRPPRAAA